MPKVKGSRIAIPTSPESPGTAPKYSPMKTPRNRYPIAGQAITDTSPLSAASNMKASRQNTRTAGRRPGVSIAQERIGYFLPTNSLMKATTLGDTSPAAFTCACAAAA